MVGETDSVQDRMHTLTAKCASKEASVYQIPTKDFIAKIKKDSRALKILAGQSN